MSTNNEKISDGMVSLHERLWSLTREHGFAIKAYRDGMRDSIPSIAVFDGCYQVADYCWEEGDVDEEIGALEEVLELVEQRVLQNARARSIIGYWQSGMDTHTVILAILDLLTEGAPTQTTLHTYQWIENGINQRADKVAKARNDALGKIDPLISNEINSVAIMKIFEIVTEGASLDKKIAMCAILADDFHDLMVDLIEINGDFPPTKNEDGNEANN